MYEFIKRLFDVLLSIIALIVLSPICVITAICIKVCSPGPIFYVSERVGKRGKTFRFYKFRSMHVPKGKDKGLFLVDQERAFPFGQLIRKLKIDELPQLINIVKNDMSIVGPRPMTQTGIKDMYFGKYSMALSVKPGLTSPASLYDYVIGNQCTSEEEYLANIVPIKRELELYYVNHRSLAYDCSLIWRTIVMIIKVALGKKNFTEEPECHVLREEGLVK